MASETSLDPSKQKFQNVMIAFGLSAGLLIIVTLIGALITNHAVMVVLAAAAFAGAGIITMRVRPNARPSEPVIGAALLALVLTIVQLSFGRASMPQLSIGQVLLSALLFIAFAAALAWMGARIGMRGGLVGRHHASRSL